MTQPLKNIKPNLSNIKKYFSADLAPPARADA